MGKVFWGLLFLFLDVRVQGVLLTPDFVGYILIGVGVGELPPLKTRKMIRILAVLGLAVSAISWLTVWSASRELYMVVDLLSLGVQLWTTYYLVLMVEELEKQSQAVLGAGELCRRWKIMAVGLVSSLLLSRLQEWLALAALLVGLVAAVVYIAAFYRSKKRLEQSRASG
ncbi:MAG: hypothetical protein ACOX7N_02235 [Lawsonibacter sp.]|jgi:hypothetical protein